MWHCVPKSNAKVPSATDAIAHNIIASLFLRLNSGRSLWQFSAISCLPDKSVAFYCSGTINPSSSFVVCVGGVMCDHANVRKGHFHFQSENKQYTTNTHTRTQNQTHTASVA